MQKYDIGFLSGYYRYFLISSGFLLLLLSILPPWAYATPVPMGVDGIIYGMDNITRAGRNVMISINDSASDFYVEGHLRNDGSYSAVVNGNSGDQIEIIVWTPYNRVSQSVIIDGVLHGYDISLNFSVPSEAPSIGSEPVTDAYEDTEYIYAVEASDANDDPLAYLLLDYPAGMEEDGSGIITWTPVQSEVGLYNITIQVSDGIYNVSQTYVLNVSAVNDQPLITSDEVSSASVNRPYSYQVTATDEDNSSLIFSLSIFPQGMTINASGYISWLPDSTGTYDILVNASDGQLSGLQSFQLFVNPTVNSDPVINSSPELTVLQDSQYSYDIVAYDSDGDSLLYMLLVLPSGMSINNSNGEIRWVPTNGDVGIHQVKIKVDNDDTSNLLTRCVTIDTAGNASTKLGVCT